MKYSSHGLPRVREVRGAAQVSELNLQRRAAALEEEMTEAARQSAREIAALKLKLAEKEAPLAPGREAAGGQLREKGWWGEGSSDQGVPCGCKGAWRFAR